MSGKDGGAESCGTGGGDLGSAAAPGCARRGAPDALAPLSPHGVPGTSKPPQVVEWRRFKRGYSNVGACKLGWGSPTPTFAGEPGLHHCCWRPAGLLGKAGQPHTERSHPTSTCCGHQGQEEGCNHALHGD